MRETRDEIRLQTDKGTLWVKSSATGDFLLWYGVGSYALNTGFSILPAEP